MRNKRLKKLKFIVTAGPTREYFDPVRYISNRSSGKMGYAIADAARKRGHSVVLISGPVELRTPAGVKVKNIISADDMFRTLKASMESCDVLVMAAAVCDFMPASRSRRKIKKKSDAPIRIVPTVDVLKRIRIYKAGRFYVGFAAETNDVLSNAQKKLVEKGLDMIVANDVSLPASGFESDYNKVSLINIGQKNADNWLLMKKTAVAGKLVREIERRYKIVG